MAEQVDIDIVAHDKTSGIIQGIFQGIGQSLANFAMQIPGAIMNFGASIMNEAMEAQNGLAQLEAVIKSTGGAAGMTSQELTDMADELSKVTRFSDDAIIGGENLLLTFTNIGKDIFPDATKAILDMSTAMNQDLKSSAIQLGKALNDPIDGVGALTRVGVQFTDEQKNMIESLVKSGDVAAAQAIILEELQKEFGGSAEAAGQTFAGQLDILKNNLNNVKEEIGMALLPVLNELAEKYLPIIVPMIEAFGAKIAEWIPMLGPVIDRLINVATAVWEFLQPAFQAIGDWWNTNGTNLIFQATTFFDTLWRGLWTVIEAVRPFVDEAMQRISDWWEENNPVIIAAIEALEQTFIDAIPVIGQLIADLSPMLLTLLDIILDVITLTSQMITGDWTGAWQTFKTIVVEYVKGVMEVVFNLGNEILEALGLPKITITWEEVWKNWVDVITSNALSIADIVNNMVSSILEAVSKVKDAINDIYSTVEGVGTSTNSIIEGVGTSVNDVITGVGNMVLGVAGGSRAAGGPVMAGGSYLVGEQGAEIFRPSQSGTIIPNGAGGGSINITLQYQPSVALGNQYEAESVLLPFILQGIRAAQANGLVPVGG